MAQRIFNSDEMVSFIRSLNNDRDKITVYYNSILKIYQWMVSVEVVSQLILKSNSKAPVHEDSIFNENSHDIGFNDLVSLDVSSVQEM